MCMEGCTGHSARTRALATISNYVSHLAIFWHVLSSLTFLERVWWERLWYNPYIIFLSVALMFYFYRSLSPNHTTLSLKWGGVFYSNIRVVSTEYDSQLQIEQKLCCSYPEEQQKHWSCKYNETFPLLALPKIDSKFWRAVYIFRG